MKFFVLMGLAIVSAVCMSQTTVPETEKASEKTPISSARSLVEITPKTEFEQAVHSLLDDQYAWDQFKHRTTLIWACRAVKTGKIVDNSYCASQPMVDSRWPDKNTPEDYRGVRSY